jgi:hypothetical protein
MNRWLGRNPRSAEDVRRMQACCDSAMQCVACPFRPENKARSLTDLLREQLEEK